LGSGKMDQVHDIRLTLEVSVTGNIFDIKKFAIHDGPGIRTTVFFSGCPLNCHWCHNPECRHPEIERENSDSHAGNRVIAVDTVMAEILKDNIFYEESGGGVTFSGGEPTMQMEVLTTLLTACRQHDLHTVVDTSGYAPHGHFEAIANLVDLFLYDLKVMYNDDHIKHTGVPNQLIHSNLTALAEAGAELIIRLPQIPGITDTSPNIESVLSFLQPLTGIRRVSLLPYNKLGEDKLSRFRLERPEHHWNSQTDEELDRTRQRFESEGYEVTIGG